MSAAFDETEALRRTRGDRLLLAELIEIFLEDSPQHLRTAEDALARGDAPALRQAVHTLKGSMTTFVLEERLQINASLSLKEVNSCCFLK